MIVWIAVAHCVAGPLLAVTAIPHDVNFLHANGSFEMIATVLGSRLGLKAIDWLMTVPGGRAVVPVKRWQPGVRVTSIGRKRLTAVIDPQSISLEIGFDSGYRCSLDE